MSSELAPRKFSDEIDADVDTPLLSSRPYRDSASGSGADDDLSIPSNHPPKSGKLFALTGEQGRMMFLLLAVILIGTANRVTFKIMQYANMNYSYFVSQFTTLIYIPVNFAVIWFKLRFTNQITQEQREFPKRRFAVMGFLDSMQGLLIVAKRIWVLGRAALDVPLYSVILPLWKKSRSLYVPGMMQNLLLQGVVPVTMLFSVALLRPKTCNDDNLAIELLEKKGARFRTKHETAKHWDDGFLVCVIKIGRREIKGFTDLQRYDHDGRLDTMLADAGAIDAPGIGGAHGDEVVLHCSAKPWSEHIKTFYQPAQYVGAAVIIGGLLVSVWPSVTGAGGAGPILWDMVFFLATVPTAISAVYKEIAFRSCQDMDVWYLNGWVSLFQFLIGLLYAPLAATMTGVSLSDIPSNLSQGFQCFLLGTNFITKHCSPDANCGTGSLPVCCDSCDGSVSSVSSISAFWGMVMYMVANILYNILLVSVIKHGSAALMYVASTVVLPLGALCFTVKAFMGVHAQDFNIYDGVGLVVVLVGLVIYRFVSKKETSDGKLEVSMSVNVMEPSIIRHSTAVSSAIRPRSTSRLRSDLYGRLGLMNRYGAQNLKRAERAEHFNSLYET